MRYEETVAISGQPPPGVGDSASWAGDAARAQRQHADGRGGSVGPARPSGASGYQRGDAGPQGLDVHVRCDRRAPGAARSLVESWLGERVAAVVLESAQLLISELVTNSVCHSGVSTSDLVVVRVRLSDDMLGLEVEDPGRGGVIARRAPDRERGGGLGLNVVHSLSRRWGHERAAIPAGTRVWAQLPLTAPIGSAAGDQSDQPGIARVSATAASPAQGIDGHAPPPRSAAMPLQSTGQSSTPSGRGAVRAQPGQPAGTAALAPSQRRAAERRAALQHQHAIQRWLHHLSGR